MYIRIKLYICNRINKYLVMYRIDYSQIKKGDTVYIASDDKRNKPYSAKVTSIGRKYITIDNGCESKFDKETGNMENWSTWTLYPNEEIYRMVEMSKEQILYINRNIDSVMRLNMTQDELDMVYNIIKKYKK